MIGRPVSLASGQGRHDSLKAYSRYMCVKHKRKIGRLGGKLVTNAINIEGRKFTKAYSLLYKVNLVFIGARFNCVR